MQFYRGQVIVNASGKAYSWTRWGRVGEKGQGALTGPTDIPGAIKAFKKKFKDKCGECRGLVWLLAPAVPLTVPHRLLPRM